MTSQPTIGLMKEPTADRAVMLFENQHDCLRHVTARG